MKRKSVAIAPAALFLAFVAGLALGALLLPPSGLVQTAVTGIADIRTYVSSALFAHPNQHLQDRRVPGDGSRCPILPAWNPA